MSGSDDKTADLLGETEWIEPDGIPEPLPRRRRSGEFWRPERRRLAGLTGGVILLVVILVVAVNSCGGAKGSAERAYLTKLAAPAAASERVGAQLATLLEGAGTRATASSTLARLAGEARQNLAAAEALNPPARLRPTRMYALQALQLRADALQAMGQLLAQKASGTTATELAAAGSRLVTSDVIWHDLVQGATRSTLAAARITGASPPRSRLLADAQLVSTESLDKFLKGGRTASSGATLGSGPVLKLGDHGAAVGAWQRGLNRWLATTASKTPKLTPDGSFGPATDALTKALQTSAKLVPDGIVGARTRQALVKALAQTARR